jgi:hypothetical protein
MLWKLYKNWLLACAAVMIVVLGGFWLFFAVQYPGLKMKNYDREFAAFEKRLENRRLAKDVEWEQALQAVRKARAAIAEGKMDYQDFAELKYLNQLPRNREPMGREYNRLFRELEQLVDQEAPGVES